MANLVQNMKNTITAKKMATITDPNGTNQNGDCLKDGQIRKADPL